MLGMHCRRYKRNLNWVESIRVVKGKSDSVSEINGSEWMKRETAHFQGTIAFTSKISGGVVLEYLLLQSEYLSSREELIESTDAVRMRNGEYEMLVNGDNGLVARVEPES